MHHGQSRGGEAKNNEKEWHLGEFINLAEMGGEYAMCIIDLGGVRGAPVRHRSD